MIQSNTFKEIGVGKHLLWFGNEFSSNMQWLQCPESLELGSGRNSVRYMDIPGARQSSLGSGSSGQCKTIAIDTAI